MATPPEIARLSQAAFAALSRRDFESARTLARQALLLRPLDANAHQVLGVIGLEIGDAAGAKKHLSAANAAAPNQAPILNSLGVALRRLGEIDAARAAFQRAGELGLIDGWRNLGNLEELALRFEASVAAYQKALRIAPRDAASHAALARAFERKHDLSQAKAHAEQSLASDPGNENARLALAQILLRETNFAAAETVVTPVTQNPAASLTNQALAWGHIGEARDKAGDAEGAFAAFTSANRILMQVHAPLLSASHLLYHPDGVAFMTALAEHAAPSSWRHARLDTPAPVFLVGFPRSGTTLLDQILSSHSAIFCIEEREHFANALAGVIGDKAKLADFANLGEAEIAAARADYWRRVRAENDIGEKIVIDKLPLNIVVLPLIKRVFPDSKIIFALRDPRDVILSCYQQRFGMNAAMAQFLDLNSAAAYYDKMMSLFEVCRARFDFDLHQVRYEDVVADLEGAARGLSAFLGVPYEPSMLAFRETALKREINTPSARQVIEPLYNRSVGRWRAYARALAPALAVLAPWAERYGYARD